MKVIKAICSYILTIILALAIIALVVIHLVSSYVLDENYILTQLDEQNYYDEIYENIKSNFENYIYQSGLNEDVLDDIVSKEKVKKDTKIIISNIYDGLGEEIETETIEDALNQKIKDSLGGSIPSSQEKAIKEYVSTICKEYKTTIMSTKYTSTINEYLTKINEYMDLANKAVLITILASAILLCLLTIRRIYRVFAKFGIALSVSGSILIFVKYYVFKKVKISGITILNEPISKVIRNILIQTFGEMVKYGYILLILGLLLIIVYSIIKSIRQQKREKAQYTPENE